MAKEQWQLDIEARDRLDDLRLIDMIADRLYPEIPLARDRKMKVLEIPEMHRLIKICILRAVA